MSHKGMYSVDPYVRGQRDYLDRAKASTGVERRSERYSSSVVNAKPSIVKSSRVRPNPRRLSSRDREVKYHRLY